MYNFANYFLFTSFLLLGLEGLRVSSQDTVQAYFLQDFGANGVRGPYNVTIANALRPGAVVSVVTKSGIRGSVNLISDDIYVIHVDARIQQNHLEINTSKRLNVEWNTEVRLPNPVVQGAKTTTTLVYEEEGYHIFINGRKVAFYSHRTDKAPKVLNLQHDYIYEIMYLTTTDSSN